MTFLKNRINPKKLNLKLNITATVKNKKIHLLLSSLLITSNIITSTFPSFASEIKEQPETQTSTTNQPSSSQNWPSGPNVGSESAILIDANTGTILYEKNIHSKHSPASTTKILTALIASETSLMDEMVTFSHEAVFSCEPGSSNMGMDENEALPMEQALYGVLVGSANETSNAIAEHIGGSIEGFADMMNEKAKSLGTLNSNFMNPHGLDNDNHYTTAYDLSLIAQSFFANELLCKMSSTPTYHVPQSETQPDDDCIVFSKNKLLPDKQYSYEYLVGSKTGYTNVSRQTLVSCASKDGLKLICVVLKAESPDQFTDTTNLFDYGFSNFKAISIADNEEKYSLDNTDAFGSELDIFGNSTPILTLNKDDYIILPTNVEFQDTESTLSYDIESDSSIATINYTYDGVPVGQATVDVIMKEETFDFNKPPVEPNSADSEGSGTIFINVVKVMLCLLLAAAVILSLIYVRALINSYQFNKRRRARLSRRKYSDMPKQFDDFN